MQKTYSMSDDKVAHKIKNSLQTFWRRNVFFSSATRKLNDSKIVARSLTRKLLVNEEGKIRSSRDVDERAN